MTASHRRDMRSYARLGEMVGRGKDGKMLDVSKQEDRHDNTSFQVGTEHRSNGGRWHKQSGGATASSRRDISL